MTVTMLTITITVMASASFAGGVSFKAYSTSQDVVHLALGFCCYGIANCLFLMVLNQTGIARAMTLSSVLQIALTAIVAVLYFRESLTPIQCSGVVLACAAAVLVMIPDS